MLGFGTIGQFAIGQVGAGAAEFIGPDKWLVQFTNPVRFKLGLNAAQQQALTFYPTPIVSFGWFGALAEPVRQPARSPAALSHFQSFHPAPSPFVATGWFNHLSEPVRQKIGLRANLHPFGAQDTNFTPNPAKFLQGWFGWLSEPKRFLKGLTPPYQVAHTAPPRLLPTPSVTVTISAKEINLDAPLMAINVVRSNPAGTPVASAKVSIIEIGTILGATSVIES